MGKTVAQGHSHVARATDLVARTFRVADDTPAFILHRSRTSFRCRRRDPPEGDLDDADKDAAAAGEEKNTLRVATPPPHRSPPPQPLPPPLPASTQRRAKSDEREAQRRCDELSVLLRARKERTGNGAPLPPAGLLRWPRRVIVSPASTNLRGRS